MPFLLGCMALFFPRLVLALVWLFAPRGYIGGAFDMVIWPILGFIFLPLTTLAYVFAYNSLGIFGEVPPFGWVLIILAILGDLGLIGGGSRARRL